MRKLLSITITREIFRSEKKKRKERERNLLGSEIDFKGLDDRIILTGDRKGPKP